MLRPNWKLFWHTFYIFWRNEPRPCAQILNGSPLGYDFKPFVDQLVSLRGSRRGGRISRLAAVSFRRVSGSQSSQTRRAPNVGFKIPNPKDVVENILKLSENDNNNNPTPRTNRLQPQSFRRASWQRNWSVIIVLEVFREFFVTVYYIDCVLHCISW